MLGQGDRRWMNQRDLPIYGRSQVIHQDHQGSKGTGQVLQRSVTTVVEKGCVISCPFLKYESFPYSNI